ncbi:MAG: glycosyltransferase family 4 protein [Chloroflexi bacterium]|nr:glycosyltransferase family 4 protein [Chloroflexota bacterium]
MGLLRSAARHADADERPAVSEALLTRLARLAPRAPALRRGLFRSDADIIHAFTIPFESLVLDAAEAAQERGVPLVLTPFFHTGEQNDPSVSRGYGMRHQLAALRRADAVMAMTEIERGFLAQQGVPAERIKVVGGGINPAEVTGGDGRAFLLRRKIRRPLALFLGAVTYDKGAVHVLEAMQLLWRRNVPAHLAIAGTIVTQFSNFFRSLQPKDLERCHLLGPVSDSDRRDLLAACDVLAMPSRVDSFGLAYLEAWANGKPVIGARAGGVPSLISHEQDGYLVNFGDIEDLAHRLRYLMTYQRDAQEMGERGKAKLEAHYTWDKVYDNIREVYREALDRRDERRSEPG